MRPALRRQTMPRDHLHGCWAGSESVPATPIFTLNLPMQNSEPRVEAALMVRITRGNLSVHCTCIAKICLLDSGPLACLALFCSLSKTQLVLHKRTPGCNRQRTSQASTITTGTFCNRSKRPKCSRSIASPRGREACTAPGCADLP
jgi:hypothetical protein